MRTYTLKEAARICGYKRPNTFREKFLTTESCGELVAGIDAAGRLQLHAERVEELAKQLEYERAARGNWRPRNLGNYAKKRMPVSSSTLRPHTRRTHKSSSQKTPVPPSRSETDNA